MRFFSTIQFRCFLAATALIAIGAVWWAFDAFRDPAAKVTGSPENCLWFLKWFHRDTGKANHFTYALTRSAGERVLFRSFNIEERKLVLQIDGYMKPLDDQARRQGGALPDHYRLQATNHRTERLTGDELTPEAIRELIARESYEMLSPVDFERKHVVFVACGFTDAEMDEMESREIGMAAELEKFYAIPAKRYESFGCAVSTGIVGADIGRNGLEAPWLKTHQLQKDYRQHYSSSQSALMDKVIQDAVDRGRFRIEREFDWK